MEEEKELSDLFKDYRDCIDKIRTFNDNNYIETMLWATQKYNEWLNKDQKYALSITGSTNIPIDDKAKAWNSINNFKIVLEKIALIKKVRL